MKQLFTYLWDGVLSTAWVSLPAAGDSEPFVVGSSGTLGWRSGSVRVADTQPDVPKIG